MHTIYEGTIACTINENNGHTHQVETPNSLYVPKLCERLISLQYWAQSATSSNEDTTPLYGTLCVTHHDCSILIWVGGLFVRTISLDKNFAFTEYCTSAGYDP